MDVFSPEKRSQVMSKVKNKNTKPELIIRSKLHKLGFRFRIQRKDLPGKPDIVFLYTVAFGISTMAVNIQRGQQVILIIGIKN